MRNVNYPDALTACKLL